MPMTEAQKRARANWVEKNKDKYYAKQRAVALKYYHDHKAEISEKKKVYYQIKKAKKTDENAVAFGPVLEANFVTE